MQLAMHWPSNKLQVGMITLHILNAGSDPQWFVSKVGAQFKTCCQSLGCGHSRMHSGQQKARNGKPH